jgi:hypothetical protein
MAFLQRHESRRLRQLVAEEAIMLSGVNTLPFGMCIDFALCYGVFLSFYGAQDKIVCDVCIGASLCRRIACSYARRTSKTYY